MTARPARHAGEGADLCRGSSAAPGLCGNFPPSHFENDPEGGSEWPFNPNRDRDRAATVAMMDRLRAITGKNLPGPRERIIVGPDGMAYRLHSMR